MSEDHQKDEPTPIPSNQNIVFERYKNKFWRREDKNVFTGLLMDAFGSSKEPVKPMEDIFNIAQGVVETNIVFRFLAEGRIGQAIDYMKRVNGISMQKMDNDFKARNRIRPENNISVRAGVFYVNDTFQNEINKKAIVEELAHEYAAWYMDSGRLRERGIPSRFGKEKPTSKTVLATIMYTSAVDAIMEDKSKDVSGQISDGLVDFWESV